MNAKYIIGLLVLCILIGEAGAVTTIPAGWVNSYSLNTNNETYKLAGDIYANGTALSITRSNITLDGMGHNITYSLKTVGYGIYASGAYNPHIYNVTLINGNHSLSSYGMYMYKTDSANIFDVQCAGYASYGLYVRESDYGEYINSVFSSYSSNGVFVTQTSEGNFFDGCTISSDTKPAFTCSVSNLNYINDCFISAPLDTALRITNTGNSTIENTTAVSVSGYAIQLYTNAINNTFKNSNGTSTSANGIILNAGADNNTFINTIGKSTSSQGILMSGGAKYNSFENCTGLSTTNNGIYISSSNSNYFSGLNALSTLNRGIQLFSASGNTFDNSIVSSPIASAPHDAHDLTLHGDSITEGLASGGGETVPLGAWGLNLSSYLNVGGNWYVSNIGKSGATSSDGLKVFTQYLDVFEPEYALILFGANDIGNSVPQQATIDNILHMAELAETNGTIPYILLTPATGTYNYKRIWLDQNLSAQANASGYNVINTYDAIDLVPNNGLYDGYNVTNYVDTVHPNHIGNTLIANAVYAQIIADNPTVTNITESHNALTQTVNISQYAYIALNSTNIPYSILDSYDGTAVLSSNNTNATISRNETAFIISTGYLAANSTYYYNVQIPNHIEEMLWYDWDPTNETCNAKVQIGNSTPYTTWNITTFNVTNGHRYALAYAGNGTEVAGITASGGQASIIITGLADGLYWLVETGGFVNVPAVAVVIVGAGFVGASFINAWYRRRRNN